MIELQHIWKQFVSVLFFADLNLNFQSDMLDRRQWLWKNHFAQYACKNDFRQRRNHL